MFMSRFMPICHARTQPLINEFCRKYELIMQPLRIAWNVKPTCGLDQWKNMYLSFVITELKGRHPPEGIGVGDVHFS